MRIRERGEANIHLISETEKRRMMAVTTLCYYSPYLCCGFIQSIGRNNAEESLYLLGDGRGDQPPPQAGQNVQRHTLTSCDQKLPTIQTP